MPIINLVGQIFSRLTVIEFVGTRNNETLWRCKCECGNETVTSSHSLKRGNTRSCGCLRKDIVYPHEDLAGQKYNFLTFIKRVENRGRQVIWLCECDCGNLVEVSSAKVKRGHTKSCGCLLRKSSSERAIRRNKLMVGDKHPKWREDLTEEDRINNRNRNFNPKTHRWRQKVYKRDRYTCQTCGIKCKKDIVAHHIYSWNTHPKLRFVVNNGICLCASCHNEFHIIFGFGNNNKKQFSEFLRIKNRTYEI